MFTVCAGGFPLILNIIVGFGFILCLISVFKLMGVISDSSIIINLNYDISLCV